MVNIGRLHKAVIVREGEEEKWSESETDKAAVRVRGDIRSNGDGVFAVRQEGHGRYSVVREEPTILIGY